MKVIVAAFYADVPDKPSRFSEFLPFMLASKRALSIVNPDAKYIILTDVNTVPFLYNAGIDYDVIVPVYMPLMLKIVFAQRMFVKNSIADLIVLPDVDCIANQDLRLAIPEDIGFATTHRGVKFEYKINNLAYIRDKELASWFFDRAYSILRGWPREKQEWEGDQESWQSALAAYHDESLWYSYENLGDGHLVSRPEGRDIHIYPCDTHNCMIPMGGNFKPKHTDAFMVHFKGGRKRHLAKWMEQRFGSVTNQALNQ